MPAGAAPASSMATSSIGVATAGKGDANQLDPRTAGTGTASPSPETATASHSGTPASATAPAKEGDADQLGRDDQIKTLARVNQGPYNTIPGDGKEADTPISRSCNSRGDCDCLDGANNPISSEHSNILNNENTFSPSSDGTTRELGNDWQGHPISHQS